MLPKTKWIPGWLEDSFAEQERLPERLRYNGWFLVSHEPQPVRWSQQDKQQSIDIRRNLEAHPGYNKVALTCIGVNLDEVFIQFRLGSEWQSFADELYRAHQYRMKHIATSEWMDYPADKKSKRVNRSKHRAGRRRADSGN